MLAALDEIRAQRNIEFAAIAPQQGRLADELAARGISHAPFSMHEDDGRRLPREAVLSNLRAAIESLQPDILHANSLAMGRLTGALGDSFAVPRIAHLRDIIRLSKAAIADLNRNDRLIAVSRATKTYHCSAGMNAEITRVIHNGVDCDVFRPRTPTGDLNQEFALPPHAFTVLCVGQIGLRKGQDVLAEAAAGLQDDPTEFHYLIVGERNSSKAESIDFEQNLAKRFAGAGLRGRLHLLGYREDIPRLMNEAGLLVHPAHQEPLGRVLLEAAASGLPIIATDVGGTCEILEHGVSAELIPAGDPGALADALSGLAAAADRRQCYASAARHVIETRFTIETAARNLVGVYESLNGTGP